MACACRVSELRAAELLDDLCEDMHLYTWTAHPDTDALSISEPSTTESSTTEPSSASSDKAQVITPSELPESGGSAATVDAEESTKTSPSPSLVGKTVSNLRVKIHWRWQRTSAVASTVPPEHRASKSELDARRKQLKSFCYGLVERTEERLTTYLAADAQHHEGASCPRWAWVAPDGGIWA
jgi:hypothetical protein